METSCRKKYKPSPKKWILASSYPEFRRNSALIPANAGLFHYAANNPVKYTDPDGRYIHITITNKKIGIGHLRTADSYGNSIIVQVPTYLMTVYDDATRRTLNYEVTRHTVLDKDGNFLSNPDEFATYEPKDEKTRFKGRITQKNCGKIIELLNFDSPQIFRGDLFRSDNGSANTETIEIHVGGDYVGFFDNESYNTTSFGCFTLQGEYVNGDGWDKFITDICKKLDFIPNKHIIIEVQKIE